MIRLIKIVYNIRVCIISDIITVTWQLIVSNMYCGYCTFMSSPLKKNLVIFHLEWQLVDVINELFLDLITKSILFEKYLGIESVLFYAIIEGLFFIQY